MVFINNVISNQYHHNYHYHHISIKILNSDINNKTHFAHTHTHTYISFMPEIHYEISFNNFFHCTLWSSSILFNRAKNHAISLHTDNSSDFFAHVPSSNHLNQSTLFGTFLSISVEDKLASVLAFPGINPNCSVTILWCVW